MHKLVPASLALAVALATGFAYAESGEADPAGSRAVPSEKMTKAERARARKERLSETARARKAGELNATGEASGAPAASDSKYTKAQRRQARKQRLSEAAKANKSGEIQSGETAGSQPSR